MMWTLAAARKPNISAFTTAYPVLIFFKTLYAFVIVHLGSRRVVHVNVTDRSSDAWVAQQLRNL